MLFKQRAASTTRAVEMTRCDVRLMTS